MSEHDVSAANLGPLLPLLEDPAVSEIFVDSPSRISMVRGGKLEDVGSRFDNEEHLLAVIRAIIAPLGCRFDESNPLLEARLFDGTRVSAVIGPIALDGPALVLSKARQNRLTEEDLLRFGVWDKTLISFLRACVAGRLSIIVAGNSASGKTTLMNLICAMIPAEERIITVEETNELWLTQQRVLRLEARPPNLAGKGAVTLRDLMVQALRMYPERLIVGELRGAELWPLIQAINNGHHGSMATMHATSPRDALARLEVLATSSDPAIPLLNVREQLASALDLIVQISRLADGTRRITQIAEVQRLEREAIAIQDLFTFVKGPSDGAQINGHFVATGQIPSFLTVLKQRGVDLPLDIFKQP
jgi:pilus assembly protein CpaF